MMKLKMLVTCLTCVLFLITSALVASAATALESQEMLSISGGCFQGEVCTGKARCDSGCIPGMDAKGEPSEFYLSVVPRDYDVCAKSWMWWKSCRQTTLQVCGLWHIYYDPSCTGISSAVGYVYEIGCP